MFDGGDLAANDRLRRMPRGWDNLDSLRSIIILGNRGTWEVAISKNSLREVEAAKNLRYLNYAYEWAEYWATWIDAYGEQGPVMGHGARHADTLDGKDFRYLSKGDRILLQDALILECETFLTMDAKLARNAKHIDKMLGLWVVEPVDFWEQAVHLGR